MFMGILNAIFSPFIILYLLMYSFFRYFEVSFASASKQDPSQPALSTGIPQEPISHRQPRVHALREVEVPRVQ